MRFFFGQLRSAFNLKVSSRTLCVTFRSRRDLPPPDHTKRILASIAKTFIDHSDHSGVTQRASALFELSGAAFLFDFDFFTRDQFTGTVHRRTNEWL